MTPEGLEGSGMEVHFTRLKGGGRGGPLGLERLTGQWKHSGGDGALCGGWLMWGGFKKD